jgi:hypothetical protein
MGLGCVQTSIDQLISSDIYRGHVQQQYLHDSLLYRNATRGIQYKEIRQNKINYKKKKEKKLSHRTRERFRDLRV